MPRLSAAAAALLCAGALACASGAVARPPRVEPLADVIAGAIRTAHAEPWSERPLAWSDFKGTPPAARGDRGAVTAYTLFHAVRCTGDRFEFRVVAGFLHEQSWVAPEVLRNPTQSARSLRHEQTHFDLSEVYARRLRRHYAGLTLPCTRPAEDLDAAAERFIRQEADAQVRYDDETSHGRLADRQRTWDADVASQLLSLAGFRGSQVSDRGPRANRPDSSIVDRGPS